MTVACRRRLLLSFTGRVVVMTWALATVGVALAQAHRAQSATRDASAESSAAHDPHDASAESSAARDPLDASAESSAHHDMHSDSAEASGLLRLPQDATGSLDEVVAYMCPIHSDYTAEQPGTCPRDGMHLVPSRPFDVRDYDVSLTTVPSVPEAGVPLTLRFEVHAPGSGELVRDFQMVHEQRYHLFVVSQDMSHFEHIHPVQGADGAWTIEVELPKPGYYKLLSDFVPTGGASQFVAMPLVTAGYAGDLVADGASLEPDTRFTKTVGDLTATLVFDPDPFVAGLYGHLNFYLTHAETGEPVTDLQPYLGAFGHTLILSEDMVDYVHSHPIDLAAGFDDDAGPMLFMLPMGVDPETLRGGPEVTFDGLMPRAGTFRAFTQIRWRDTLHTFAFTFVVAPKDLP